MHGIRTMYVLRDTRVSEHVGFAFQLRNDRSLAPDRI